MNSYDIQWEVENLIQDLHSLESRKTVLLARTDGESLESIAKRLNVTRERIRQIEAKSIRKFAIWCGKTGIIGKIIADCNSDLIISDDILKLYFGNYYFEMIYLLRLYKDSFYYSGTQLDGLEIKTDSKSDKK